MPLLLSILISAPALACGGFEDGVSVDVLAISPAQGATHVPVDSRVVVQVRGDARLDLLGVALMGVAGAVPGEWSVEPSEAHVALWTFSPDQPLRADSDFRIVLDSAPDSTYLGAWEAGFTTGSERADDLGGEPSLELMSVGQQTQGLATRCEPDQFRRVDVHVKPVEGSRPSEEWVLLYLLEGEEGDAPLLVSRRLDGRDWDDPLSVLVPDVGDSFCLIAAHRSPSGAEVISDPACFEAQGIPEESQVAYYGGGSCSACTTPPTTLLGGVASLLTLLSRR